jgi:hypothetical protein
MQTIADLIRFLPQCCDAQNYLLIGQDCAAKEACYNDLRPLGAGYWFSLPYRFGWPLESMIVANLLLMLGSSVLSLVAIDRLAQPRNIALPAWQRILFFLASALVHVIFLYPTLRHAITDAPASLFALIGTWLLLITPDKKLWRGIVLSCAGLSLGLAAWMRVFYLVPLLAITGLWIVFWLFSRQRKTSDLCLLFLLPMIALQYISSWNHTHRIEYLPPNPGLIEWHMTSIPTGYDTVLPGYTYAWNAPCEHYASMQEALDTHDLHTFGCQLIGKLDFYLGSYSALTYWDPDEGTAIGNLDPESTANTPEHPQQITAINMRYAHEPTNIANHATAMQFWKGDKQHDGEIYQTINVTEDYKYKISLKAWSHIDHEYLALEVRDHATHEAAYGGGAILTHTPQEFQLGRYLPMSGVKDVVITFPYISADSELGQQASAVGWNDVNQGDFYLSDVTIEAIDLRQMRIWSLWILIANGMALASCFLLAFHNRQHWQAPQWMAFLFWLGGGTIALALAPEQRYAISIMVTTWIFFLSCVAVLFKPLHQTAKHHHGHFPATP